jgi:hypothetical protein
LTSAESAPMPRLQCGHLADSVEEVGRKLEMKQSCPVKGVE